MFKFILKTEPANQETIDELLNILDDYASMIKAINEDVIEILRKYSILRTEEIEKGGPE